MLRLTCVRRLIGARRVLVVELIEYSSAVRTEDTKDAGMSQLRWLICAHARHNSQRLVAIFAKRKPVPRVSVELPTFLDDPVFVAVSVVVAQPLTVELIVANAVA